MKKCVLIYHSGYGHTKKVAQEVYKGLCSEKIIEADMLTIEQAQEQLNSLKDYDAFVFGSPTYMGGPSAEFKQFADATSKIWSKMEWKNKLAAGFTNSGGLAGDKFATLMYFITFACQHGMIWASLGIEPSLSKEGHGSTSDKINRLDSSLGLMTQSDHAAVEHTPAPGDLKTAFLCGQRIAQLTSKWPTV